MRFVISNRIIFAKFCDSILSKEPPNVSRDVSVRYMYVHLYFILTSAHTHYCMFWLDCFFSTSLYIMCVVVAAAIRGCVARVSMRKSSDSPNSCKQILLYPKTGR